MSKDLVNGIIWWGGIIAYSIYYKKAHPEAGFFASLFDIWGFVLVFGLWILQAVVGKLFYKGE